MSKHNDDFTTYNEVHQGPLGGDHAPSTDSSKPPRILDAARDQLGGHWLCYGTPQSHCWFSVQELQANETEVLNLLATVGYIILTQSSKNAFKETIEAHSTYRPALVAAHPGWLSGVYIFGDGAVARPPGDDREVIVAFQKDGRFTPKGAPEGWQIGAGPIVSGQPLCLFVSSYALTGAILRLAPPDFNNPLVEIVGPPGSGKSTLNLFAASIWAGDPTSDLGGAESWDATPGYLDRHKAARADGFLPLEEANLAGLTRSGQREMLRRAPFQLAAKGGRKRLTDTAAVPNVNVSALSSSNEPLVKIVGDEGVVGAALGSRIVSITIPEDSPHGVLSFLPAGYRSSREAMESLRRLEDQHYGHSSRAFVKRLVDAAAEDEEDLQKQISGYIAKFFAALDEDAVQGAKARAAKTFALTYAAGMLARKWGIFPKEWGSLLSAILQVYCSVTASQATAPSPIPAINKIRAYVERHKAKLVRIRNVQEPYSQKTFQRAVGFLRKINGCEEVLIPTEQFQRMFPDHTLLMKELRDAGLAKTERGKQAKLSIKAPKRLCPTGRVYCIQICAPNTGR